MSDRPAAGAILEIDQLSLGPIGTNCYLVRESGSDRAFVVDPGDDAPQVLAVAADRGVTIEHVLVTHCHWDHIGAVAALVDATGAEVWMSSTEAPVLEDPTQFPMGGPAPITPATVDHRLDGGERIDVAGIAIDVLSTPGHSPGHLTFIADGILDASGDGYEMPPVAFVGDVIFQGSVGRTDLPFADGDTLAATLELLVGRLAPETMLLSGHGGMTSMVRELASNPFLQR
ncbi:MAG: fold metallo-hydrolase [Thermoleophilia bacterium]|nr:fold metallo-hydrolase [Thermoleophilia bacterium]